jgi:hypothetical protein
MKNGLLQYIILYVLVACVALVIATLARMFAALMGFDSFSAFIVFIVVLGIEAVVYLSIHVILQELMLPWIGKGLSKIGSCAIVRGCPLPWLTKYQAATIHVEWQITYSSEFSPKPFHL